MQIEQRPRGYSDKKLLPSSSRGPPRSQKSRKNVLHDGDKNSPRKEREGEGRVGETRRSARGQSSSRGLDSFFPFLQPPAFFSSSSFLFPRVPRAISRRRGLRTPRVIGWSPETGTGMGRAGATEHRPSGLSLRTKKSGGCLCVCVCGGGMG